jgi:hypothetical protein
MVSGVAAGLGLRERGPGHAVIHAVLCQAGMLRSRGRIARMFGISPLTEEGRKWFDGALGELAVGEMLAKLGPRWMVLHAVPVGRRGADIDHVVVGPAGVFTVNTKNHSGQNVWVFDRNLMVAGTPCDHVRKSEYEATRAAKLLSSALGWPVPVRAVLAVFNPARLDIKHRPTGVDVMEARKLVRWLKRKPDVLTEAQLAEIESVIGTPSTWQQQPHQDADLDRRQAFKELQSETRRAQLRRVTWALVLMTAMTGGAVSLALSLAGSLL